MPAGQTVGRLDRGLEPRCPSIFRDPERFDPTRYEPGPRGGQAASSPGIPFGAGRHRCVGAAFAMMQLKAIFSILLRRYEFELAQPPEQLPRTTTRRWSCSSRSRAACATGGKPPQAPRSEPQASEARRERRGPRPPSARIAVDLDLCQGHAVCVNEAPELFRLDPVERKVVVLDPAPPGMLRPMLDAAVRHCPTHALRIVEE